jgi:nucleoside-diphosphate-sugar epimerase
MKVLVAGATGALGPLVVRELKANGHSVIGLTATPSKLAALERLGASGVVADLLDGESLSRMTQQVRPEAVVNVASKFRGRLLRSSQIGAANRLRVEGTRNLLAAAIAAGARRYVSESMIFIYGYGAHALPVDEDQPIGHERRPGLQRIIDALASSERQVREATEAGRIEGMALRFGLFHGPDAPSTHDMIDLLRRRQLPLLDGGRAVHSWIDVADAATAVVAALERGAPGAAYNVVDDQPVQLATYLEALAQLAGAPRPYSLPAWLLRPFADYAAAFGTARLPVSNARLRAALGWRPRYPTYREAFERVARSRSSGSDVAPVYAPL